MHWLGPKVIKQTIKTKASDKLTTADKDMMALVFDQGTTICQSTTFNIQACLENMELDSLLKLKEVINNKNGKTTHMNRMKSICEHLPVFLALSSVQSKVASTIEHYKCLFMEDLGAHWIDDAGCPKLDDMREVISNLIAVKQSHNMVQ